LIFTRFVVAFFDNLLTTGIGKRIQSKLREWIDSRARFVSGEGTFIDDIKVPHLAYAAILRSPYAHARINAIDCSSARKASKIVRVFSGRELATESLPITQAVDIPTSDRCLALEEVVYNGQPVAAVVGEDRYAAEDALEEIVVEYEPLEPVLDAKLAIDSTSPRSHLDLKNNAVFHKIFSYGDVDGAFSKCDKIVSDSFTFDSFSAVPLETFGVLADFDKKSGFLHIIDNCQVPVQAASVVSKSLSIPLEKIVIEEPDIGGGFGVKGAIPIYDVLISALSIKCGKPVKWSETRTEHMLASSHGSERHYEVKAAVMSSGEVLGLKVRALEDVGAYFRTISQSALISCLRAFSGPYRIPAFEYNVSVVLTNKCPAGPSRGNGKNHHSFVLERIMDRIAQNLKLDPVFVRELNLIQPDEFPYTSANGCTYDSGNYLKAVEIARSSFGYPDRRMIGKGTGLVIVVNPGASNSAQSRFFHPESVAIGTSEKASITIDPKGKATVVLGSVSLGQGHESVVKEIVSETLGIAEDRVTLERGNSSTNGISTPTSGTYSSRFAPVALSALVLACRQVKEKLDEFGFPKDDEPIVSVATYSHTFGRTTEEAERNLAATFAYEVHVANIDVDPETGKVSILRYLVVDDCGRILNQRVVEGQVHGGTFNGVAGALFERFAYSKSGQLLNSSFESYLSPTSFDVPNISEHFIETKSPFTLTGAKGVGESGALGAQPAIMSAIEDALGIKVSSSHVTPQEILALIRSSSSS
jgi:2-furoyl-CoA dehydrogenase large subunit